MPFHKSQIPPPPPPPIPTLTKSTTVRAIQSDENEEEETNDDGQNFVSNFKLVHINREEIIKEIKSLAQRQQEYDLHLQQQTETSESQMLVVSSILQPIIQNGPVCGLAALAMIYREVSEMRPSEDDKNEEARAQEILEEAQRKGFTKNGEMFSAENMASLAEYFLKCEAQLVDMEGTDDLKIKDVIIENIFRGNYFLVPYDADRNHRPGSFKGHKAHWCVITGFAVVAKESQQLMSKLMDELTDAGTPGIQVYEPQMLHQNQKELIATITKPLSPSELFVITRQSKSTHIGMWSVPELITSNRNLAEIAPKILTDSKEYVLHPLSTHLKDKMVLIKIKPSESPISSLNKI